MKYLLKIAGLSLLIIPFMTWELLVAFWTFRTDSLKQLCYDYADTIGSNYRKAFPRKSKSRFNLQKNQL